MWCAQFGRYRIMHERIILEIIVDTGFDLVRYLCQREILCPRSYLSQDRERFTLDLIIVDLVSLLKTYSKDFRRTSKKLLGLIYTMPF